VLSMVKRLTVGPLRAHYDRHYVCQDVMVPMSALEDTLGLIDEEFHLSQHSAHILYTLFKSPIPALPAATLPIQPSVAAGARSEQEWGELSLR